MNLLLIGPPNAGKGTQAKKLIDHFQMPHVSTGDLLRDNIARKTELGILAKSYVDSGGLVPDELVIDLVDQALSQYDLQKGVLFDGYPRNIAQAENLDALMAKHDARLDTVILMQADDDVLINRATGRRVCSGCGATYHVTGRPPKISGFCDICHEPLIHRRDDKEDVISHRIDVYKQQTRPLVEYYSKTGRLLKVRGEGSAEEVFEKIMSLLGNKE